MMTEAEQRTADHDERIFAERTEFEVALSGLRPKVRQEALVNTQKEGLLLLCRNTKSSRKNEFDLHLAETIVQTGQQEITLSLRQYVRSVRYSALFFGILIGVLLGGAIMFAINEHSKGARSQQQTSASIESSGNVPSVNRFSLDRGFYEPIYNSSPLK